MTNDLNIVIPMAGRGSRFSQFNLPKPLINIDNKPMIWHAIKSLELKGNYIFITRKYDDYLLNLELNNILNEVAPDCIIIEIDYVTDGPACSALLAKEYINNNNPLFITNCDRISEWDSNEFLNAVGQEDIDGLVVTWDNIATTESFIELDKNGYGIRLVEKEIISDHPLNGMHYWKKGKYFVESTEKLIQKNIRTNNEFYISTTYNQMIEDGYKIKTYKLGRNQHFAVGDPADLKKYKEWKNLS
jgi:NDP-sugar pyrophosphorylase family protein